MENKVLVTMPYYTPEICREYSKFLFIYGDNEIGVGMGGQACIRDESNTLGVCTKKSPSKYWSDEYLKSNMIRIDRDIDYVTHKLENYEGIVFPSMGLGTGRAQLHIKAPRTFLFLSGRLLDKFNYNNLSGLRSKEF